MMEAISPIGGGSIAKKAEEHIPLKKPKTALERRDGHLEAFFERREKQAHAYIRLMRLFEQQDVPESEYFPELDKYSQDIVFDQSLRPVLEGLGPEIQKKCKWAWNSWVLKTRNARRSLEYLLGKDPLTPEMAGARLFLDKVKSNPTGLVRFIYIGPFYYFVIEKREDYNAFIQACEYRVPVAESGGCHMGDVWWGDRITATLIQMGVEVSPEIITHESQHFLNHELGDRLTTWEPGKGETDTLRRSEQGVKDELLAYLRDGTPPETILDTLANKPLYSHLYQDIGPEEAQRTRKELGRIVQALLVHPWISFFGRDRVGKKHARELMVASLLDIPFSHLEKYINESAVFYAKRLRSFTPPPRPLDKNATEEEKRVWREAENQFRQRYNSLWGFVPEFGLLSLEEEEARGGGVEHEPPPPPALDDSPEEQALAKQEAIAFAERWEKYLAWKNSPRNSRRLDAG